MSTRFCPTRRWRWFRCRKCGRSGEYWCSRLRCPALDCTGTLEPTSPPPDDRARWLHERAMDATFARP